MNTSLYSSHLIALAARKVWGNCMHATMSIAIFRTVDSHMETIAEMMKEEEGSKMIHTYNIGDTFRGYSGKMSTR